MPTQLYKSSFFNAFFSQIVIFYHYDPKYNDRLYINIEYEMSLYFGTGMIVNIMTVHQY